MPTYGRYAVLIVAAIEDVLIHAHPGAYLPFGSSGTLLSLCRQQV